MWVVVLIVLILSLAGLVQELLLLLLFKPYIAKDGINPSVSVLVAMRNEEENAARCLDSLLAQEYAGDYDIWVADDDSEDRTLQILNSYAHQHDRIQVISVHQQKGNAMGKANAIAHLASEAQGEILLVLDADSTASKHWVRLMANHWSAETGLVNGLTEVEDHDYQHLEWLHSQGMLHVMHHWKVLTAIGNNMGVSNTAYQQTGGYENITFSLTEDRALAMAVAKRGYRLESRVSAEARVTTQGMHGWANLMKQRKRWMSGAVQLPWWIVGMLSIQALYYPAVLLLCIFNPEIGVGILVSKAVVQLLFIGRIARLGKIKTRWSSWFLYEFYSAFMAWFHIALHLMPGSVAWKGRDFTDLS